ncbi:phosphoenolpyruvate--protein phosphotransferase [Paenibacillus sp. S150]|uniref:phosphoenolpyruvate--protein phosphotransferase n=1 Tax=Paenibacillus sp. S150 TaxID=2749826 RepID=UPI001C59D7D1|nr:phosphoenolpyruvate--protein phosphotransferase [Paenibacillus sp. S150]MBW4085042.1 phosphoenolpyruvate--protein phosphotransferase [Paenibacillus sp. S150]
MLALHNGYGFGKAHFWTGDHSIAETDTVLVIGRYYNEGEFCKKIKHIRGIIAEHINETSHLLILAKAYDIPVIIADLSEINSISGGCNVFMEAAAEAPGFEICREETMPAAYRKKYDIYLMNKQQKLYLKDVQCISPEGKHTKIVANIVIPEEVHRVAETGGEGIGVFRTEFLFLNRSELPNEEEQFMSYKYVAEHMGNKPVMIRTIDVGGDKKIDYLNVEKEENPFLGCRGIRFSLQNPVIFKQQLRAILRASAFGEVGILLPMVTVLEEVLESKAIIQECKQELDRECLPFHDVKIGIMVEVPAVAYNIHKFAKHADFFSIGTNDLIQYFYAADRTNYKVAYSNQTLTEDIYGLIQHVIEVAHANHIPCAVCGEIAAKPDAIKKLLEFQIDELSVSTSLILETKESVLGTYEGLTTSSAAGGK